jgi:predicted XRE-type DNA-binding protein
MKAQAFNSVWDALEDMPEQPARLRARSALIGYAGGYGSQSGIEPDDQGKAREENAT